MQLKTARPTGRAADCSVREVLQDAYSTMIVWVMLG